jgi:molybdate transport system substrate-binding protein
VTESWSSTKAVAAFHSHKETIYSLIVNKRSATLLIVAIILVLGACSGDTSGKELVVSAAASLTDAFSDIEVAFEEANPNVDVVVNLAGSSVLREQILEGAPVDVFASANEANMQAVVAAGLALEPKVFASNDLVVAVPTGNPAGVTGLESFSDPGLLIGLCAPGVPCGDLARAVLSNAGVTPEVDTNEPDVRSLLTKIAAGELDAGITYSTDVTSTDGVEAITIPGTANVVAEYQIVALNEADAPEGAHGFLEFVVSEAGQSILMSHGFGAP